MQDAHTLSFSQATKLYVLLCLSKLQWNCLCLCFNLLLFS